MARRLEARIADAARAYGRDRYQEALTNLRELAKTVPHVSAVRELLGLTYYRLGRWKDALRELEAFVEITSSIEQLPVIMDCNRALGRHKQVVESWAELRHAGAGSDVLTEGRIVMAGSLVDQNKIQEAIAIIEPAASRPVRKPLSRHLRQWFVLADLYERSGDIPRAREFFRKVAKADPEMPNVIERLSNLG
jgi:tetratricopeptide (TPR) repeat protein